VTKIIPCVYILTNKNNNVFYVGVTNNILRRVYEHKEKLEEGFTAKYNLNKLVYYEFYDDMINAIIREKQLKGGSRLKKMEIIKSLIQSGRICIQV
jgi:putative endonuclease